MQQEQKKIRTLFLSRDFETIYQGVFLVDNIITDISLIEVIFGWTIDQTNLSLEYCYDRFRKLPEFSYTPAQQLFLGLWVCF